MARWGAQSLRSSFLVACAHSPALGSPLRRLCLSLTPGLQGGAVKPPALPCTAWRLGRSAGNQARAAFAASSIVAVSICSFYSPGFPRL